MLLSGPPDPVLFRAVVVHAPPGSVYRSQSSPVSPARAGLAPSATRSRLRNCGAALCVTRSRTQFGEPVLGIVGLW